MTRLICVAKEYEEAKESGNRAQNTQRITDLKNNILEYKEKRERLFEASFEIADKYHFTKDKTEQFEALPPILTEKKFFEYYPGLIDKFLKKNLKLVPSIYDKKGKLINLYRLYEMVDSFSGLEKFKNSLENKSYSALGVLVPLKDSKMLNELKETLTELNEFLQKQHKKLSKDYAKNYEENKQRAQQARKELDEIETLFKTEADGTLKGYAEAMYFKLQELLDNRDEALEELLGLDKELAVFKTLENHFEKRGFKAFLESVIALRYKPDMILYEKEKARKDIEAKFNIKPIKEFGTNYAEFYRDGVGAIENLMLEAKTHKESGQQKEFKGQVVGAFYHKELGDIDLIWGDSKKGLAHILERRKQDFIEKGLPEAEAEQKALKFVKSLPDIIENGNLDEEGTNGILDAGSEKTVIVFDYDEGGGKWILTGYIKGGKVP